MSKPTHQEAGRAANFIVTLKDDNECGQYGGDYPAPIEVAGLETSWETGWLVVYPADSEPYQATPLSIHKSEVESISLCNDLTGKPANTYTLTVEE